MFLSVVHTHELVDTFCIKREYLRRDDIGFVERQFTLPRNMRLNSKSRLLRFTDVLIRHTKLCPERVYAPVESQHIVGNVHMVVDVNPFR